ncbi:hypothetical protein BDZ85DRAFT_268723 [Elsinoe ampelina]|uniref:F-box domain-containing protein n=1 Tax=Elsinoe ampelina TaxID=302913 RepID=A0A6A6G253_9PEZI|nr:hypothetical protein BDZ85DRAFT_268723 [Elsinoe ampelina]
MESPGRYRSQFPPLARLGYDITSMILGHVSNSDLGKLCLVNSATRALVEPVLYSEFTWTWSQQNPPALILFMRTILGRTDLAAHTKSVKLLDSHPPPPTDRRVPRLYLPTALLNVSKATYALNIKLARHLQLRTARIAEGDLSLLVVILLSQLRSLRSIQLGRGFTYRTTLITKLGTGILPLESNEPYFPHLRSIKYESLGHPNVSAPNRDEINRLWQVVQLPGIETASLGLDLPDISDSMFQSQEVCQITTLEVAYLDESFLHHLLSRMPKLKKLTWTSSKKVSSSHTHTIDLGQLQSALQYVKDTLTHLTIKGRCDHVSSDSLRLTTTGSLCRLREFMVLKYLELPWQFLVGFRPAQAVRIQDVIPEQLESLVVTDKEFLPHSAWYTNNVNPEWNALAVLKILDPFLQVWRTTHPWLTIFSFNLETMDRWRSNRRDALNEMRRKYGLPNEVG